MNILTCGAIAVALTAAVGALTTKTFHVETVIAAVKRDEAGLKAEAADVVYHLTVLLAVSGVSWTDVLSELSRRTAQSGLEEKASRPKPS